MSFPRCGADSHFGFSVGFYEDPENVELNDDLYPGKKAYIDETFVISEVEHICDLLARLDERFGAKIYDDLPNLFNNVNQYSISA